MEPTASDAEPLRGEQPALIRSANRLFVAAHELGNLECRQQPIRQPAVRGCDLANDWSVAPSMLRIRYTFFLMALLRESVALYVVRSAPENWD